MTTLSTWALVFSLSSGLALGCAAPSSNASSEADVIASADAGAAKPDDAKLVAELTKALEGQEHISESEFPWTVVQGDGKGLAQLDAKAIDERLGAVIEPIDGTKRDLAKLRSNEESFDELFDSLEDGGEDVDAAYSKVRALMKTNLTDLRFFQFDVNEVGDQDTGPIILVVVGRSASGKLIALVTYAVAT